MSNAPSQPIAVVGAESLTSALYRKSNEQGEVVYRFSIHRLLRRRGTVSQWYRPRDLVPLLKLVRVLAAEIDHDGWLEPNLRTQIRVLANELDELLARLRQADETSEPNMRNRVVHELRQGLLVVRIRNCKSGRQLHYSLSVHRLYKNGDLWHESTRLGRDDIPAVRFLLDQAHDWIPKPTIPRANELIVTEDVKPPDLPGIVTDLHELVEAGQQYATIYADPP